MAFVRRLGVGTFATTGAGIAALLLLPRLLDTFDLLQITVFCVMAILALSLALIWGLGGILCFGQAAFFGLGGYTYAVAVQNMSDSTLPVLLSCLVPALFALALGYFMFLGRLSELYVGVVTLCVSLILFNVFNSTSDPFYTIGSAALNGFNGMSSIPQIHWPGDPDAVLEPQGMFALVTASLIGAYGLCKLIAASTFGRVVVAVKQNEERAELMGYDAARIKLAIFVIGAGMAGYAGCLFANWNAFISPNVFSLGMTAQIIIWNIVGGRETFVGPVLGATGLQYLTTRLGNSGGLDANLVLGGVLMVFVVLVPEGVVPFLHAATERIMRGLPLRPGWRAVVARREGEAR